MKNMMEKPMRSLAQRDMVVDSWFMVLLKLMNLKSCGRSKMDMCVKEARKFLGDVLQAYFLKWDLTLTQDRKTITAARLLKCTWRRARGSKFGYVLWFSSRKWSLRLTTDVLQMFMMMAGTLSCDNVQMVSIRNKPWFNKVSYSRKQNTY